LSKLVQTRFTGVASSGRDVLLDDKPQTEWPLGAWRLAAGSYRQTVWSMFSPGGA